MAGSILNHAQKVALAVLPKFSSMFSLFGSSWIIIEVVTNKTKRSHPYHRLLCAMSVYDVLESVWNFASTWPIPPGNPNQVWAVGNTESCSCQGFFLTLSVAVPIYNAFLALYYMLVVNHNLRDKTLRRRVEPVMHIIAFVWAFGTAFSSAMMGLLNDANLWCWIAPYPAGCLDSWRYGDAANCERGDNAFIYRWAFYFAPLWLCIFVATVCSLAVYRNVRSLDRRTLRYRRPESVMDVRRRNSRVSFRTSFRAPSIDISSADGSSFMDDLATAEAKNDAFLSGRRRSSLYQPADSPNQNIGLINQWISRRKIYREDYSRSVEVSRQAMWYLAAFYITHVWSTTNRIMQQVNNGSTTASFAITLIHSWFDPFQGFLNFVVYQRPRYLFHRKRHPEIGRIGACRRALRFSYLAPITDDSRRKFAAKAATATSVPAVLPADPEQSFRESSTGSAEGDSSRDDRGPGTQTVLESEHSDEEEPRMRPPEEFDGLESGKKVTFAETQNVPND